MPETGGALFVSNHMSFIDAIRSLLASIDRPIRFLILKGDLRCSVRQTVC